MSTQGAATKAQDATPRQAAAGEGSPPLGLGLGLGFRFGLGGVRVSPLLVLFGPFRRLLRGARGGGN